MTTMRADPQNRLPRRLRRSFGIWRDTQEAWALSLTTWRRLPVLFIASLILWGLVRLACLSGLAQAHLAFGGSLTPSEATGLLALAIIADLGPLLLAAILWPPAHRLILGAPQPDWAAWAATSSKMLGTVLVLAIATATIIRLYLAMPLLLPPMLGPVSTVLALILLLPAVCTALIGLLRLSFGLPAISLGLPRALAEGWNISRFHITRTLCVWLLAWLPIALPLTFLLAAPLNGTGWAETLLRPLIDVLAVSLTGSLTGLFYRELRLPRELRPDVRPSWNRALRREPILS